MHSRFFFSEYIVFSMRVKSGKRRIRVAFLHHSLRSYRVRLFVLLSTQYDIQFFLSSKPKKDMDTDGYSRVEKQSTILKEFRNPLFSNGFAPGLFFKLIRFSPDVIIASTYSSYFTHIGFIYSRLFRVPFIVFSEDWVWPQSLFMRLSFPFIRHIIVKSDAIIAAGTKAKEFAERHGASRVFLGFNSALDLSKIKLDTQRMKQLRDRYRERRIILYQSRVVKYKGLDILLRAFSALLKKEENVTLLIGGDGDFLDECVTLAQQLCLSNYEFLGFVPKDEIAYYFNLCDVFVLPTRYFPESNVPAEAWGMVVNEAMSVGKPIVATSAVAAAYDLIERGENGFMVPHSNPNDLARALQIVLQSPSCFGQQSLRIIRKATAERQHAAFSNAISYTLHKTGKDRR